MKIQRVSILRHCLWNLRNVRFGSRILGRKLGQMDFYDQTLVLKMNHVVIDMSHYIDVFICYGLELTYREYHRQGISVLVYEKY